MVPYVNPKFPPKNIKELVAYGKTNPVPFGSAGIASMTHLAAETLKDQHGITLMQHVVYKAARRRSTTCSAGTIPMTMATVTQALPQYQAGLLGALGVTADEAPSRAAERADLPRAGLRYRGDRMVRPVRADGHAEADRRQAQRRDAAHPRAADSASASRRSI